LLSISEPLALGPTEVQGKSSWSALKAKVLVVVLSMAGLSQLVHFDLQLGLFAFDGSGQSSNVISVTMSGSLKSLAHHVNW